MRDFSFLVSLYSFILKLLFASFVAAAIFSISYVLLLYFHLYLTTKQSLFLSSSFITSLFINNNSSSFAKIYYNHWPQLVIHQLKLKCKTSLEPLVQSHTFMPLLNKQGNDNKSFIPLLPL